MADKPAPVKKTKAEMAEDSLAYFQNHTYSRTGSISYLYWFMGGLHEVGTSTIIRNFTY